MWNYFLLKKKTGEEKLVKINFRKYFKTAEYFKIVEITMAAGSKFKGLDDCNFKFKWVKVVLIMGQFYDSKLIAEEWSWLLRHGLWWLEFCGTHQRKCCFGWVSNKANCQGLWFHSHNMACHFVVHNKLITYRTVLREGSITMYTFVPLHKTKLSHWEWFVSKYGS